MATALLSALGAWQPSPLAPRNALEPPTGGSSGQLPELRLCLLFQSPLGNPKALGLETLPPPVCAELRGRAPQRGRHS